MSVKLPSSARILLFAFNNGRVGIGCCFVGRKLSEKQNIFRTAYAHFCAVLALLRPAKAIGLIVFAHNVRCDGYSPHIPEAVLDKVHDRHV